MEIGLIWGLRIIAAFQKWFQKLIHNPMNPLGTPYKSYLAIPIVVVISVLVTDIFYHNPSHAVDRPPHPQPRWKGKGTSPQLQCAQVDWVVENA